MNPLPEDPVEDDEILYRRIPLQDDYYNEEENILTHLAFKPWPRDTGGISLTRDDFATPEQAAQGQPGKEYRVAVLKCSEIRKAGGVVCPNPQDDNPGHCLIKNLNFENKDKPESKTLRMKLARREARIDILGPFTSGDN